MTVMGTTDRGFILVTTAIWDPAIIYKFWQYQATSEAQTTI
jgi:hypothetical protein